MAKMKNFMMDVEDHVNAYFPFYGGDEEFIIDEVVAEVEKKFGSMGSDYAKKYIESQLGEM
jgi:hypothetical protein